MRGSTERREVPLAATRLIELGAGAYRAAIAPQAGGRLASLTWHGDGRAVPLLVVWSGGEFEPHAWPKAGAFPMLPFANRLHPQGFRFGDRVVRPHDRPAGTPMHGFAHRRPWTVTQLSDDRAVLGFVAESGEEGWPWAWSARQEVQLDARGLNVRIAVRNESREPMPVGLGWHPYHPLSATCAPGDLQFEAAARHELDAAGRAGDEARPPAFSLRAGETAAFSGWAGALRIRAAGGAIVVRSCSTDKLVLHRPASGEYLCAEPVNLLPGQLGEGLPEGVLSPGEVRELTWSCAFESLAHD